MDAGRHAAGELQEAAGRRQLEGRQGALAGPEAVVERRRRHVFVSTEAGRADSAERRAELSAGGRHDDLLWVSNTESDVFRLGKSGPVYYLVSGRWFSAPDFTGPWTFATPTLPADFKKIPAGAPAFARAGVGARHHAGRRGRAARADSADRARQQERRSRRRTSRIDGEPQFQPIEQTTVSRGRQHRQGHHQGRRPVLHVLPGRLVHGEEPPTGPWEVTGTVPKEIYEIPVSSPSHNVTYVTVVEDNRRRLGDLRDGRRLSPA